MGIKLNIAGLKSNNNETQESPDIKIDVVGLQAAEAEAGFGLTFTEGKEYNLDDIIYAKRRNNSECPLIVKYDSENANDKEIVKIITKLILHDYNVEYDDEKDDKPNDDMCYANRVYHVTNFYNIFNIYFNRYYSIYFNKLTQDKLLGSVSLSTIVEEIQTVHDSYYSSILKSANSTPYNNSTVFNKPQVQIEYGTQPDGYDDDYDYNNPLATAVSKFKLGIKDGLLTLYYDNEEIENSGILLKDLGIDAAYVSKFVDLADCAFITVINDIELELPRYWDEENCPVSTSDYVI